MNRFAWYLASAVSVVALAFGLAAPAGAQRGDAIVAPGSSALKMVVVLGRHGVRSPTHPGELDAYSSKPWATWNVPPGNLTARGASLMQAFGAAYRSWYGSSLGFSQSACPPGGAMFVWADVDQRTRATGRAVADGFAPGCNVVVGVAPTAEDPLFDPQRSGMAIDSARANAAVLGAIGGDPANIDHAYAAQFSALAGVMGRALPPTVLQSANEKRGAALNGGLDIAADAAENLLLEYTDGHPMVGWGRVNHSMLVQLLQLHVLAKRVEHNRYASQVQSSSILTHIMQTLHQAATGLAVVGTRVPVGAEFVFLSGHDTQLEEVSAILGLSWIVPGDQMNDTPPGSALVFELRGTSDGAYFVRTFFAEQTLDDMRAGRGDRPARVPVYVPGCPSLDCPVADFEAIVNAATVGSAVVPW